MLLDDESPRGVVPRIRRAALGFLRLPEIALAPVLLEGHGRSVPSRGHSPVTIRVMMPRMLTATVKVPHPPGSDGPGESRATLLASRPRRRLQRALMAWYGERGRDLRIRTTREPWHVLVSEVMSQQTQISRVDEAWVGFMARFPTPAALAEASTAEVLMAWQGLGYNRRAVALQRAARAIVARHDGRVPARITDLEALPGVGPYTSRAVAALAFGQAVAAVDTNVRRVIRRLVGAEPAKRELQSLADEIVDRSDPGAWTHALMELGATVCRSRTPACAACPIRRWCASADAVEDADSRDRRPSPPFELTSRWLRGRIVERLRAHETGAWVTLPGAIGRHGPQRIAEAVTALQRDGLLERRADGMVRLPSSVP